MLRLTGQNLRLAAKNGSDSKTPGLHLSATHGKDSKAQPTACLPTWEGTAQLDSLLKSPRPDLGSEVENQPVRRPLTLAPLELPEDVKEAQRQKLKFIQQEAKPPSCKLDVTVNEPRTRKKVKTCVRQRVVKAAACPSASTEPLKAQQQNRSSRPQLTRCNPIPQNGDWHLEEVVCLGTPAPLCNKPAPPLLFPHVKARAARGAEAAHQNPSTLWGETGRRRLRLSRAQCLEEDQCNSNTSTGGLSADKGKLAQGVQGKGQRLERAPRGQPHAGKGIKEPLAASCEHGSVGKSHQEDCSQQSGRCTLNRQLAEGGSGEPTLDGVKPSASNWRLKRKKPLITKHNDTVPLDCLHL